MFELDSYLKSYRRRINTALEAILRDATAGRIGQAMGYSLMAGGKRLRPILCLAAAEAVNGRCDDVLPAACALEMIHTYSLIHDDLPAMDNDRLRRGKPTCHIAFDEASAILAGDALLTLAFETLSSLEPADSNQAPTWLAVIRRISAAAGCGGMIGGQMLDIASEGHRLNLEELKTMHALKTGALIRAALGCGAVLGGGNGSQIEALEAYGDRIGLAFQVADDILNIEGDPQLMGKAAGTDRLHGKSTYPALLGLEASRKFARRLVQDALQCLAAFDQKAEPLRAIATYVIERNR